MSSLPVRLHAQGTGGSGSRGHRAEGVAGQSTCGHGGGGAVVARGPGGTLRSSTA